jgi:Fic family protein
MDKNGYKMDISESITQKLDFNSMVYQRIFQKMGVIDVFKGNWQAIENEQSTYLKELRKIATIESIGSSTRIEGATLTDKEVEKLLKSVKISKLESRDEQEVIGYYEALQVVLDNYEDLGITERYIHQLHGILLKYSSKDKSHKGAYKRLSNQVVANYPDGTQRIIFKTTEPHLTPSEMQELIGWTKEQENNMHPLMIIAVFVYEFLSVHPYQDGNGRLSRLLTTLMMLKSGYRFIQYVSFEHIIEERKEAYYRALMEGQKNRYTDGERIDQWVMFFLDSLIALTEKLELKYQAYSKLKTGLNTRQQQVFEYIKKHRTANSGQSDHPIPI